ncbi:undecaprenyl-diphosphatase [Fictibacillus terranigra]|uniref:Undecaprenyl-diphosphatase n=1 Tax=Fictibacillus terranigra TaxID=3058424 RepID=A0ABT8E8G3_9BACL|nr:undecaprenyl-diphosphatase [Fictibacillus sp. CENA-BCM004]MDN4074201.1 undecaprenyl-diphosphatase [Fictibacillus sp. CENA-BCM004]
MSLTQFNNETFRSINELADRFSEANPVMVFLAEYMPYALGILVIGYCLTRSNRNRLMIVFAIMSCGIAEILGKFAGLAYSHHQPFAELTNVHQLVEHVIDNSFPSDHTIIFFSICTSIWLFRRKEGVIWLLLALCVAFSRVWVGVHYPIDVAAGALIGMISSMVVYKIIPLLPFAKPLMKRYAKSDTKERVENF